MSAPERDWVQVVAEEHCDECGLRASSIPRLELAGGLRREAGLWASMLREVDPASLRTNSHEGRWSALEYAAHVRDVLGQFRHRVSETATGSKPDFAWWDHEAAAVADRYNEQDPCSVAAELEAAADSLAAIIAGLDDAAWDHTATRRGRERFSLEGLVRFALHETHHHRIDAEVSLGR